MPEMHDDSMGELLRELKEGYNAPPEVPREEMWREIQGRLGESIGEAGADRDPRPENVLSFPALRARALGRLNRPAGWAAAAAALLILGLGIGRWTAPEARPRLEATASAGPDPGVLRVAALDHLVRTENLLTLVRADARVGKLEPTLGSWARGLLTQTRLFMDAQGESDPVMAQLLEDLELVLVQIVGVASAAEGDGPRLQSELDLAVSGIEESEILSRIQAVIPAGSRFVGT
jgi:hypothetical protein